MQEKTEGKKRQSMDIGSIGYNTQKGDNPWT